MAGSGSENGSSRPVCAVTGANGYVGSCISRALERSGWSVVKLVRGSDSSLLSGAISWSLTRSENLAASLRARDVRALVHAAWDFSIRNPRDFERTNIGGSMALLNDAGAGHVPEIVFISTISAFEGARSIYGRAKLTVEKEVAATGGLNLRPGLVWGENSGSVFRAITKAVSKGGLTPMIGSGLYPQYLVHEDDLGLCVARACSERWSKTSSVPITVAHPQMWYFRDLILRCAALQGKEIRPFGVPWRAVYGALKLAERCSLPMPFRSDSVLSLVNQNSQPDFTGIERFGIQLRPFGTPAA
jgi:nucleoside-diphosphate-sugar epimerase